MHIGLLALVLFSGCTIVATEDSEKKCENKLTVSGVISDVSIKGGTFSDNVVIEFKDGRIMTFIKRHDVTTAFHKGKMHKITYSGDNSTIFSIKIER